jgi:hypothetical protein
MRWLLTLVLALTACEERRSFDERYNDTAAQLQNKARTLDEQLIEQSSSASTAPASR